MRSFDLTADTVPARRTGTRLVADALVRGARAELDLTPKPGLVDRRDNGSHPDLDHPRMVRSIELLPRYYDELIVYLGAPVPMGPAESERRTRRLPSLPASKQGAERRPGCWRRSARTPTAATYSFPDWSCWLRATFGPERAWEPWIAEFGAGFGAPARIAPLARASLADRRTGRAIEATLGSPRARLPCARPAPDCISRGPA